RGGTTSLTVAGPRRHHTGFPVTPVWAPAAAIRLSTSAARPPRSPVSKPLGVPMQWRHCCQACRPSRSVAGGRRSGLHRLELVTVLARKRVLVRLLRIVDR